MAERLEAQEDLRVSGDKGNMGNKELTFTFKRVKYSQVSTGFFYSIMDTLQAHISNPVLMATSSKQKPVIIGQNSISELSICCKITRFK